MKRASNIWFSCWLLSIVKSNEIIVSCRIFYLFIIYLSSLMKFYFRCYFFGDITSKRDPTMYLRYIYALYDYYKKEFSAFDPSGLSKNTMLPLVVNTSGWVKGLLNLSMLVCEVLLCIVLSWILTILLSHSWSNGSSFWVSGIGFEVLVDMLKYISPTHMVQIRISAESKNLPTGDFWLDEGDDASVTLIEISAARQDSLKRSYVLDILMLNQIHRLNFF